MAMNPPDSAELARKTPSPPRNIAWPTGLWEEAMRGLSPHTLRAYQGDWRRFAKWLGHATGAEALQYLVSFPEPFEPRRYVAAYRDYLVNKGLAPNTCARAIRALNSVVQRVNFVGYVIWTLDVKAGKSHIIRDVRGPTEEVWHRLVAFVAKRTDGDALHDLALIHALRTLALRATDATQLEPGHFSADYQTIAVVGKGGKRANVEVGPDVWAILMDLIDQNGPDATHVFGAPNGWTYNQLYTRIVRLGEAINIKLWPHALRHSGITAAARITPDVTALQRFSRHDKREVLLSYIDAVSDDAKNLAKEMGKS